MSETTQPPESLASNETPKQLLADTTGRMISNWLRVTEPGGSTDYRSFVGDLLTVFSIHRQNPELHVDWPGFRAIADRPDIKAEFPEVFTDFLKDQIKQNQPRQGLELVAMAHELNFGPDTLDLVPLLPALAADYSKSFWPEIQSRQNQGDTEAVKKLLEFGRTYDYLTEDDYNYYQKIYLGHTQTDQPFKANKSTGFATGAGITTLPLSEQDSARHRRTPDILVENRELGVNLHAWANSDDTQKEGLNRVLADENGLAALIPGQDHLPGISNNFAEVVNGFFETNPTPTLDQLRSVIDRSDRPQRGKIARAPEAALVRVVNQDGQKSALIARTTEFPLYKIGASHQVEFLDEPIERLRTTGRREMPLPIKMLSQEVSLDDGDQLIITSEAISAETILQISALIQQAAHQADFDIHQTSQMIKQFLKQSGLPSYAILVIDSYGSPKPEIKQELKLPVTEVVPPPAAEPQTEAKSSAAKEDLRKKLQTVDELLHAFQDVVMTVTSTSQALTDRAATILNNKKFAQIARNRPDESRVRRQALSQNAGLAAFHYKTFTEHGYPKEQESMVDTLIYVVTQIAELAPDSAELLAFLRFLAHTPGTQPLVEESIEKNSRLKANKDQLDKLLNYNQPEKAEEEIVTEPAVLEEAVR